MTFRYTISESALEAAISLNLTIAEIAKMFGTSYGTAWRRCKDFGLKPKQRVVSSRHQVGELKSAVLAAMADGPSTAAAIAAKIGSSRSVVAVRLTQLHRAGFVSQQCWTECCSCGQRNLLWARTDV